MPQCRIASGWYPSAGAGSSRTTPFTSNPTFATPCACSRRWVRLISPTTICSGRHLISWTISYRRSWIFAAFSISTARRFMSWCADWERHFGKHAPVAIVASPIVRRVCDVVGLGAHIIFFSDIVQALDHFGAGRGRPHRTNREVRQDATLRRRCPQVKH